MQSKDISIGGVYVYCPGTKKNFERGMMHGLYARHNYYGNHGNLSIDNDDIAMVRVLGLQEPRFSKTKGATVHDGVKVEFLDSDFEGNGNHQMVVPANRIKESWNGTHDAKFKEKQELLRTKMEQRRQARDQSAQRQQKLDEHDHLFNEHHLGLLDLLEANGLVENEDFVVRKHGPEKYVRLDGKGVAKLRDLLAV